MMKYGRDITLQDDLDRYESLRQRVFDSGTEDLPPCSCGCGEAADCEDAIGQPWTWECAREREAAQ